MLRNTKTAFMNLRPGSIFRDLDSGFYWMVINERWGDRDNTINAIYVDGTCSANMLGRGEYFRFTDEVIYCGQLGVNWFPDEF